MRALAIEPLGSSARHQLAVSPLPDSSMPPTTPRSACSVTRQRALGDLGNGSQQRQPLRVALRPTHRATAPASYPPNVRPGRARDRARQAASSPARRYPFAFHFTTSVPDPLGHPASSPNPAAKAGELFVFHSRPELEAPVTTSPPPPRAAPGDIFIAPYSGPGQDGPMIFDEAGNLVWFDPLPSGTESTNLQVQHYEGKPVLTWWQGYIPPQGFGQGEEVIANANTSRSKFRAGNGLPPTCTNSASPHRHRAADLLRPDPLQPLERRRSKQRRRDRQPLPGNRPEDASRQARVAPLDHVALSQSYASPTGSTTEWPFDYFHLNSIDPSPDGSTLISSRNTSALYELNTSTGQITAQIGGKHPPVKLGAGAATAYQHDAQELQTARSPCSTTAACPRSILSRVV